MERQKYISLVAELRQIVVAKALTLLDDHDAAEDVAGEVLMKYPTFPSHSPLINMWKTKKRATSFIAPLVSYLTTGERL